MRARHLLLFEPNIGGHHGLFIHHLVDYWCTHALEGKLDLLVSEDFLSKHQTLSNRLKAPDATAIQIYTFTHQKQQKQKKNAGLIAHDLQIGKILKQHLEIIQPSHCLLMYFDHLQLSLGSRLRFNFPIQLSGIYFRPSFHYPDLMEKAAGWKEKLNHLRMSAQLRLALSNPHFQTLFCLDPFVVPYIEQFRRDIRPVALPDGVETYDVTDADATKSWHIEPGRQVALLFGSLASRKGVFNVLEALPLLDRYLQKKMALVFSGSVLDAERDYFEQMILQAQQQTEVQLIVDDRFIEDDEIPVMMEQADVVLVTYLRHTGSSNVLIRAARAGTPVLGSDYGLVGAQIRRWQLGIAVDTTRPQAIAQGLETFLLNPEDSAFNPEEALKFSQANTALLFAETIFANLNA